jgi:ankyrin repeat protein
MTDIFDFARLNCMLIQAGPDHVIDNNYDGYWLYEYPSRRSILGPMTKDQMRAELPGTTFHLRVTLHEAVENSDLPVARFMLENGADPNEKDQSGWAPIQRSITRTEESVGVEMLQLLVKHGANLSYREPMTGLTTLELAKKFKKVARFNVLLRIVSKRHWVLLRACVKFLSLHTRAVVTANHPSRLDFSIKD